MLREIVPKVSVKSGVIAVLVNPNDPITADGETNDMRRRMMVHEEDVVVTQNGCDSLSLRAADILPIV